MLLQGQTKASPVGLAEVEPWFMLYCLQPDDGFYVTYYWPVLGSGEVITHRFVDA